MPHNIAVQKDKHLQGGSKRRLPTFDGITLQKLSERKNLLHRLEETRRKLFEWSQYYVVFTCHILASW